MRVNLDILLLNKRKNIIFTYISWIMLTIVIKLFVKEYK